MLDSRSHYRIAFPKNAGVYLWMLFIFPLGVIHRGAIS